MNLRIGIFLTGILLVVGSVAGQGRSGGVDDLKVKIIKPTGDNNIEILEADLGDYRIRYYLRSVIEPGAEADEHGRIAPSRLEVVMVIRFDEGTGVIEKWSQEGVMATESVDIGCSANGCGGTCCVIVTTEVAANTCSVCTCCESGKCRISLDSCKTQ